MLLHLLLFLLPPQLKESLVRVRVNEAQVVNDLEQTVFLTKTPSLPTTAMAGFLCALPVQGPALPRTEANIGLLTLTTL